MPTIGSFVNVGVAFDGTSLFVTDETTTIKLISPADGSQVGSLPTTPATKIGAMAFDGTRNLLWGCTDGSNNIVKVDLTSGAVTTIFSETPAFSFCDGLAFDAGADLSSAADDSLWYSQDIATVLHHLSLTGAELPGSPISICASPCSPGLPLTGGINSGIATGGPDLYLSTNGFMTIERIDKATLTNQGLFATVSTRPEDMECDDKTFASLGVSAIWVRTFEDNHLRAFESFAPCGIGGMPSPHAGVPEFTGPVYALLSLGLVAVALLSRLNPRFSSKRTLATTNSVI